MTAAFDTYSSLESALSTRFRGHRDRDWQEWEERHHFLSAQHIPDDATRAWISRQKLNYRTIASKKALKHLIAANVDSTFLEEIGELHGLRRLELEWPFLGTDLTPLLSLEQLEHLSIDSPRKLSDFSALLELPSLRTLIITNAKKMPSIEWLAEAHHLQVIGIEGAIDSPYRIESLAPLAGLRSLRALLCVSTRIADQCLSALAHCPELEYLEIARCVPRSDFELLKQAKPDLVCRWFDPEAWRTPILRATG